MKKLIILSLALVSISSFSADISSTHCQITVSDKGVALFTNEISSDMKTEDETDYQGIEGNCLDLIKDAKKNLESQPTSIKEINLRYLVPAK